MENSENVPNDRQVLTAQSSAEVLLHQHRVLQQKYDALQYQYQLLANSKAGKATLWYWRKKDALKLKWGTVFGKRRLRFISDESCLPSISVIIPTYRPNPYLKQAVRSVLEQDYPAEKLQILISVNGRDVGYAKALREHYKSHESVTVLYTEKQSVGAARNHALSAVDTQCICYLDDDDMLTTGYLRMLANCMVPEVSVVCGPLNDLSMEDGAIENDTYINRAIWAVDEGIYRRYLPLAPLFSSMPAKLYRTSLFKERFTPQDEMIRNSEDVIFWAENYHALQGYVCVCGKDNDEYYVRRLTPGSLSRPSEENQSQFYIQDRIAVLERLETAWDKAGSAQVKKFIQSKINSQKEILVRYLNCLDCEEKKTAMRYIQRSSLKQKKDVL